MHEIPLDALCRNQRIERYALLETRIRAGPLPYDTPWTRGRD